MASGIAHPPGREDHPPADRADIVAAALLNFLDSNVNKMLTSTTVGLSYPLLSKGANVSDRSRASA